MFQNQRKSGNLYHNPSFKRQLKQSTAHQLNNILVYQGPYTQSSSQVPKFILKNASQLPNRPFSVLDSHEDLSTNNSYLELYQQQRNRQQSQSPEVQGHTNRSRSYLIQRNNSFEEEYENNQSVSMKLQQILQKQINNNKPTKSKTQNTSNGSIDIIQAKIYRPHSVHQVPDSYVSKNKLDNSDIQLSKKIYQGDIQKKEKKDGQTALKNTFAPNKMQLMTNETPTPNIINQITFSDEGSTENKELLLLREENKKLITSIKKLNVDLQQAKGFGVSLQQENDRFKFQLKKQEEDLNKILDQAQQEQQELKQIIIQKDSQLIQLKQNIQELHLQNQMNNKTINEIDELKSRILSRKSQQRSSRENISSQDSREQFKNCNEILKEMDSSARIDIEQIRQQYLEDKENQGYFGNVQSSKLQQNRKNKFRLQV